jgi:predicted  nucleic acid-binding Zn-ribbon protein
VDLIQLDIKQQLRRLAMFLPNNFKTINESSENQLMQVKEQILNIEGDIRSAKKKLTHVREMGNVHETEQLEKELLSLNKEHGALMEKKRSLQKEVGEKSSGGNDYSGDDDD